MSYRHFGTILADPPWDMQQKSRRGANQHYRLLRLDEICALHIESLAAADSHLWLWTTNASIHAGKTVMEAWGFSYRSCLTWIKPKFGLGNYLRNQTEHLLFGVRGKAPILFRSQGTWFYAPVQEHSHKPEEQYAIIERISPAPRLELFARRRQAGWAAWGNELAGGSDIEVARRPGRNHAT